MDAMVNVLELLRVIVNGEGEFEFVPAEVRARAAAGVERGVQCLLDCQIVAGGRRTVWCQQHELLTLAPASARNYEMPSLAGAESAHILLFLMQLPRPSAGVVAAVHAAADWFQKTQIQDKSFEKDGGQGRRLRGASSSRLRQFTAGRVVAQTSGLLYRRPLACRAPPPPQPQTGA